MSKQIKKADKLTSKATNLFSKVQTDLLKAQNILDVAEAEHFQEIDRAKQQHETMIEAHKLIVAHHEASIEAAVARREANKKVIDKLQDFLP